MELADILRDHWDGFARARSSLLTGAHHRAARSVMSCRTPALGAQVYRCADCDTTHLAFHSCHHRACPKCGALEQKQWAKAQEAKLLEGAPYFLLTFTLPAQLREFAYKHQSWFYDAMFHAVSQTLRDFALDDKHLGGTPGFSAVLHTWTRQMLYHPHLHVVMPGVGLSEDGLRIRRCRGRRYLFPVKALGAALRNRLRQLILKRAREEPGCEGLAGQIDPKVWKLAWVTHSQAAGNGKNAVRYLARYVAKTAVSEQRLLGYDAQGKLRLKCQDSDTGKWSVVVLAPHEFLRRWSLHVLPKGLVRVRHYGFHSAAAKAKLERVRLILQAPEPVPKALAGMTGEPEAPAPAKPLCPCCQKEMILSGSLVLVKGKPTLRPVTRGPPLIAEPSTPAE